MEYGIIDLSGDIALVDGYSTYGKEIEFEDSTFPGGELHFRIQTINLEYKRILIISRGSSSDDIMKIILAKDAIERVYDGKINLLLTYMPYGRQDRVCNEGEAFSLKVIARMINNCGFNEVGIYDAHSDITTALIDNSFSINNRGLVNKALEAEDDSNQVIVAPDAGAVKKIYDVTKYLASKGWNDIELVQATKVRDLATTQILDTKVHADDLTGKTCYIVDDIGDGMRTICEITKKLKALGATRVVAIVSHLLLSKGDECLIDAGVDHVYTTNTCVHKKSSLVTAFSLGECLEQ